MHIAYVTPEFVTENRGGGLASYINNIAKIMEEYGHRVTIVLASTQNKSYIYSKNIRVECVNIFRINSVQPFNVYCMSRQLCARVNRIHKIDPIDLVQYASFMGVGLCADKSIPYVTRISSDCVCWRVLKVLDYEMEDLNKRYLTEKMEYRAITKSQYIFGPSYAIANRLGLTIHRNIEVIESPYNEEHEEYDTSIYEHLLAGKKYYLAHSSMSCLKGTHLIADVIEKTCQKDKDAFFVFAGSDHGIIYRNGKVDKAKDYILSRNIDYSDRIIFLGVLERKKLFPVIMHAEACLMPSRIDNMPNTCIEAMALGKIVIGSNGASYEQLIKDGENGFLINIDDSDMLYKKIEYINKLSKEQKNRIMLNAKETSNRFNKDNTYQNMIRYYTNVIDGWRN